VPAPDLELLESLLTERIMSLTNTAVTPPEPLARSVFNLIDEAISDDPTPRRLPGVGIVHEDEQWQPNELLGGSVFQQGREAWHLLVLCDSPTRDGGIRGKRGAYSVTKQIIEGIDGWQIIDGCPIRIEHRQRYKALNEQGELVPIAGYIVAISHPVEYTDV
jgi:hypothetical protein